MPPAEPPLGAMSGRPGSSGGRAAYAIYARGAQGGAGRQALRCGSAPVAARRVPGTPAGPAVWTSYRKKGGDGEAQQEKPAAAAWTDPGPAQRPDVLRQCASLLRAGQEHTFRFSVPRVNRVGPTSAVLRLQVQPAGSSCILYVDDPRDRLESQSPSDYRWLRQVDSPEGGDAAEMGFGDAEGEWLVAVFARTHIDAVNVSVAVGEAVDKAADYQQPWKVCAQEIWGPEQQELLDRWFNSEHRDLFVSETKLELLDSAKRNPLHCCCMAPLKGALRWAVQLTRPYRRYVDAEAADASGRTPLHYACCFPDDFSERNYHRAASVVRHLVKEVGVSVNTVDADMNTPLHLLCQSDAPPSALVELLLRKGALPKVNTLGQTPQQVARLSNNNHNGAFVDLWLTGCIPVDDEVVAMREQQSKKFREAEAAAEVDDRLLPLEDNIGELMLTDRQLRSEWRKYDVDGSGLIDVAEFRKLEAKMIDRFGAGVGASSINSCIQKYNLLVDGKMTFGAFALLMMKLPQL
eukprot:TRINITY_DN13215_c0_g3_i1.p1 TRINITY_DN13215_c0_g3~~TRINITY_DN13215_c0_g3_i1.p1  ORF type:complete len:539 (+),score=192.37 TRINITY_DN13215_c0_g3_i1:59-1618(+)